MKIELGTTAKDVITGFTGIVIGRVEYLTGCNQVLLSPKVAKDGSIRSSEWFDEQRCTVSSKTKVTLDNGPNPGFDRAAPKI
jgi:hypothetical protein